MTKQGLAKSTVNEIVKVIVEYKKPRKIFVFGSRAQEDYTSTSDIDIAISGNDWSDSDINMVRHELNDRVRTPLKIDVLNVDTIEKRKLKENILKNGKVIYDASKHN